MRLIRHEYERVWALGPAEIYYIYISVFAKVRF